MTCARFTVSFILFCLMLCGIIPYQLCDAAELKVTYKDGETQSIRLHQNQNSIRSIEFDDAGPSSLSSSLPSSARRVTIYWHMADDADLYLNGHPLRRYEPSFRTRGDEAPMPAFSVSTSLREGDVFTVGGRRGGSYGFMLIVVDDDNRVVYKSDDSEWKVYEPGDRPDWYLPHVARNSPSHRVTVQPNPWYPQKTLNSNHGNIAQSIWDAPDRRFAHMFGIVRFMY